MYDLFNKVYLLINNSFYLNCIESTYLFYTDQNLNANLNTQKNKKNTEIHENPLNRLPKNWFKQAPKPPIIAIACSVVYSMKI
jgi:hypothetical protein